MYSELLSLGDTGANSYSQKKKKIDTAQKSQTTITLQPWSRIMLLKCAQHNTNIEPTIDRETDIKKVLKSCKFNLN